MASELVIRTCRACEVDVSVPKGDGDSPCMNPDGVSPVVRDGRRHPEPAVEESYGVLLVVRRRAARVVGFV